LSHNCNWTFGTRTGIAGHVNTRAFDHLIKRLRSAAAALSDRRTGDTTRFSVADIVLAAFAVFFINCPSFLQVCSGLAGCGEIAGGTKPGCRPAVRQEGQFQTVPVYSQQAKGFTKNRFLILPASSMR
jgi:hypothetical protein